MHRGKVGPLLIFFSCRETSRLAAEGLLEAPAGLAGVAARLHLLYCRHCRRFLRQLRLLGRAVRDWTGKQPQPEGLREFEARLLRRLIS